MTIKAKICGLNTPETVAAAVEAGASHIGFVFYEKSPRNITAEQLAALAGHIPPSIKKAGVFVNPTDDQLSAVCSHLDLIQLHGSETPERVTQIKQKFGLAVMKAIAIDCADHITLAKSYENAADMLLFDAKSDGDLPGGNGVRFDWKLIQGTEWKIPWMLSGGLDVGNLDRAIRISGAKAVDVSSGVESSPGKKSIAKITAFMSKVKSQ